MKNSQKGFIIPLVIVIVALLAVGGGTYIYTKDKDAAQTSVSTTATTNIQTSTDNSTTNTDWKLYSNAQLAISFKYPATDTLFDDSKGNINLRSKNGSDSYFLVMVSQKSIDETQKGLPIFTVSSNKINSTENISVNGVTWRKLLVANNQVFLLATKNNRTYVIQYSTLSTHEPIQDIISTISLTSPVSTSTSGAVNPKLPATSSSVKAGITFSVSNNTNTLQVLKNDESISKFVLSTDAVKALTVVPDVRRFITDLDVNFDGYNDVGVFTSTGYAGVNNYYDFSIYNPKTSAFEKSSVLVEISNPTVDATKKQVTSNQRSGPQWYADTFQFNGSTFVKVSPGSPAH
jgi:hypothetical protein